MGVHAGMEQEAHIPIAHSIRLVAVTTLPKLIVTPCTSLLAGTNKIYDSAEYLRWFTLTRSIVCSSFCSTVLSQIMHGCFMVLLDNADHVVTLCCETKTYQTPRARKMEPSLTMVGPATEGSSKLLNL